MVMLSPVWTPIGSKFSMEQTITELSWESRMTSISNSFHPRTDCSKRTSRNGEASSPLSIIFPSSSGFLAMPPPAPPNVKEGRMMSGKDWVLDQVIPSSTEWTIKLSGIEIPICFMAFLKDSRFSAFWMESREAPINSTPCSSSTPLSERLTARFNAVCPPMVGRRASGFS